MSPLHSPQSSNSASPPHTPLQSSVFPKQSQYPSSIYSHELSSQIALASKLHANSSVQPSRLNVTLISSISEHETVKQLCTGAS